MEYRVVCRTDVIWNRFYRNPESVQFVFDGICSCLMLLKSYFVDIRMDVMRCFLLMHLHHQLRCNSLFQLLRHICV